MGTNIIRINNLNSQIFTGKVGGFILTLITYRVGRSTTWENSISLHGDTFILNSLVRSLLTDWGITIGGINEW